MDRGKFNGKGKFFFGSLDKYEGDFSNGDINGKGKMTYRDGHIYTGLFKDWRQFGAGKMTFRNGDVVDGIWDGETGKGTITYTDGSMYEVSLSQHFSTTSTSCLPRVTSKRTKNTAVAPTPTLMATNILGCTRLDFFIRSFLCLKVCLVRTTWRMETEHSSGRMGTDILGHSLRV